MAFQSWFSCADFSKDTKMATPLDYCRGMVQPETTKTFDNMWYYNFCVIRHMANMWACEPAMQTCLCAGSSFDFFPIRIVLSALDFGEFKHFDSLAFIEVWGNCPGLFILYVNEHNLALDVNNENSYILLAIIWSLHLLTSSSSERAGSSWSWILFGIGGKVLWRH